VKVAVVLSDSTLLEALSSLHALAGVADRDVLMLMMAGKNTTNKCYPSLGFRSLKIIRSCVYHCSMPSANYAGSRAPLAGWACDRQTVFKNFD
jgi:hypothetical protein